MRGEAEAVDGVPVSVATAHCVCISSAKVETWSLS